MLIETILLTLGIGMTTMNYQTLNPRDDFSVDRRFLTYSEEYFDGCVITSEYEHSDESNRIIRQTTHISTPEEERTYTALFSYNDSLFVVDETILDENGNLYEYAEYSYNVDTPWQLGTVTVYNNYNEREYTLYYTYEDMDFGQMTETIMKESADGQWTNYETIHYDKYRRAYEDQFYIDNVLDHSIGYEYELCYDGQLEITSYIPYVNGQLGQCTYYSHQMNEDGKILETHVYKGDVEIGSTDYIYEYGLLWQQTEMDSEGNIVYQACYQYD